MSLPEGVPAHACPPASRNRLGFGGSEPSRAPWVGMSCGRFCPGGDLLPCLFAAVASAGTRPVSLPPGSTCSPRCPASGCWCVAGTAPWAGCLPPWRRCGTAWLAQSLPWPSCPWAQVGSAGTLGDGAPGLAGRGVGVESQRVSCRCPGNDLGRVLRWGPGYSGEDPFSVLVSVDEADAVLVDRWTILLDAHEAGSGENSVADAEPPKVPVCPGGGVAPGWRLSTTSVQVFVLAPATPWRWRQRCPLVDTGAGPGDGRLRT